MRILARRWIFDIHTVSSYRYGDDKKLWGYNKWKVKVKTKKAKFTLKQVIKAQRCSTGITLLLLNLGARWGWMLTATPLPLYLGQETRYPLYKRLGGPQVQSGRMRKILPPPWFDLRTVQRLARRYTDSNAPVHKFSVCSTYTQFPPLKMK